MKYVPHKHQIAFHQSKARIRGAFAGKRGGKTEAGAVEAILKQEQKPGWIDNGIDPYIGVIIAPTTDMLRRLSLQKFKAYAKGFYYKENKSEHTIYWNDGSLIYGISSDRPQRLEGLRANWIWIDEATQCHEQIFLESKARVSDQQGFIWCSGSLGVQYNNPKNHWCYKWFKARPGDDTEVFEWPTIENPYFPKEEIESLKNTLDPRSFQAMFELNWDTAPTNVIYGDFDDRNIGSNLYDPQLPVYVAVDWGWNHPTAFLFIQYRPSTDTTFIIDEIVRSRTKLEDIWRLVQQKPYRVSDWYCDAAGIQTREQTAKSNVQLFKEMAGVTFKWKRTPVIPGIALVRSYVMNANGQRKLFVDEKCEHTINEFKNYRYKEKQGEVTEDPQKENDHCLDALRYFFVNHITKLKQPDGMKNLNRWDIMKW